MDDGDIVKKDSIDLVGNEIVLVVLKNGDLFVISFSNLVDLEKIVFGMLEFVLVGVYGKELLIKLFLWDKVKDKIVYGKDVC